MYRRQTPTLPSQDVDCNMLHCATQRWGYDLDSMIYQKYNNPPLPGLPLTTLPVTQRLSSEAKKLCEKTDTRNSIKHHSPNQRSNISDLTNTSLCRCRINQRFQRIDTVLVTRIVHVCGHGARVHAVDGDAARLAELGGPDASQSLGGHFAGGVDGLLRHAHPRGHAGDDDDAAGAAGDVVGSGSAAVRGEVDHDVGSARGQLKCDSGSYPSAEAESSQSNSEL